MKPTVRVQARPLSTAQPKPAFARTAHNAKLSEAARLTGAIEKQSEKKC
ncbi:hypothetical protein [Vibrio barjaei]|nr:hypothetical protein [Vibrio barjaei]MCY9874042.1 hypothetical protein [Vibrio barjaei]